MADSTSDLARCSGLVFGFLFHDGAVTRVDDITLGRAVAHPHDWAWLHLSLADHRARRFLESFAPMPPEARELMLGLEERIQLTLTPA